jgi:hypothetical protein
MPAAARNLARAFGRTYVTSIATSAWSCVARPAAPPGQNAKTVEGWVESTWFGAGRLGLWYTHLCKPQLHYQVRGKALESFQSKERRPWLPRQLVAAVMHAPSVQSRTRCQRTRGNPRTGGGARPLPDVGGRLQQAARLPGVR